MAKAKKPAVPPVRFTSFTITSIPPPHWWCRIPWGIEITFTTDKPAWVRYRFRRPELKSNGKPYAWKYHAHLEHNGTRYVFRLMSTKYARTKFDYRDAYKGRWEFQGVAHVTGQKKDSYTTETRIWTFG